MLHQNYHDLEKQSLDNITNNMIDSMFKIRQYTATIWFWLVSFNLGRVSLAVLASENFSHL